MKNFLILKGKPTSGTYRKDSGMLNLGVVRVTDSYNICIKWQASSKLTSVRYSKIMYKTVNKTAISKILS